jgi:hypothetical protein
MPVYFKLVLLATMLAILYEGMDSRNKHLFDEDVMYDM